MRKHSLVLVVAGLCLLGVGWPSSSEADSAMPQFVDVCVSGAVIRPAKTDNTKWDGPGQLNKEQKTAVDKAATAVAALLASTNPAGALLLAANAFSDPILGAIAKPDVYGTMQLNGGKSFALASRKKPVREYAPNWGCTGTTHKKVHVDEDTSIQINLTDADLVNDDPIGTVVINANHIAKAYSSKVNLPIDTMNQGTTQIWAITLVVTKSK